MIILFRATTELSSYSTLGGIVEFSVVHIKHKFT